MVYSLLYTEYTAAPTSNYVALEWVVGAGETMIAAIAVDVGVLHPELSTPPHPTHLHELPLSMPPHPTHLLELPPAHLLDVEVYTHFFLRIFHLSRPRMIT